MAEPLSPPSGNIPVAKRPWPKLSLLLVLFLWLLAIETIFWLVPVQPRIVMPTSGDLYLAGFSADSKTLVTTIEREGRDTGEIRLWDITTGQELGIVGKEGTKTLPNVVYFPQRNLLDEISFRDFRYRSVLRGKAVLYDLIARQERGKIRISYDDDEDTTDYLCFSPKGETLVFCEKVENNGCLKLLEVATGQERFKLEGNYREFIFSPDGKTLATTETKTHPDDNVPDDEKLILLDIASGTRRMTLQDYGGMVLHFEFSPDGKTLAMYCLVGNDKKGDTKGELKVWDLASGKEIRSFKGRGPAVFLPDGKGLADWDGENETIRFWDVSSGRVFAKVPISPCYYTGWFDGLIPIPGSHLLAVITTRHSKPTPFLQWCGSFFGISGLSEERHDDEVDFLDTTTGKKIAMIVQKRMADIQVSPDGKTLALRSVGEDIETIQVWDIPPRKPIQWIIGLLAIPTVATLLVLWRWWGHPRTNQEKMGKLARRQGPSPA
jgi:WD40 repeat protein